MANFTDVAAVRLRFQVEDTNAAPDTLVTACIEDAHESVLAHLRDDVSTEPPEGRLVLGETLLAGAFLLKALASGEAAAPRGVVVGGQRVEAGPRFASLLEVAHQAERAAWDTLAPYLVPQAPESNAGATDTVPVLGEA